jgi:hypothetical protein
MWCCETLASWTILTAAIRPSSPSFGPNRAATSLVTAASQSDEAQPLQVGERRFVINDRVEFGSG